MAGLARRGWLLRVVTLCTVVCLPATAMVATAPTTAAATVSHSHSGLTLPATVWRPSRHVDRTPVGGPPTTTAITGAQSNVQPRSGAGLGCNTALDQVGVLSRFTFERVKIDDHTQLMVNLCNGNLFIDKQLLALRGVAGSSLNIDQTFNSLSTPIGATLQNWDLSTHIHLLFPTVIRPQGAGTNQVTATLPSSVTLVGDSGYQAEFTLNTDGTTYQPPKGLHAGLTANADGTYTVKFDSSGETWHFTAGGTLLTQADRNGNTNAFHYNADNTLASITDSEGRVTTFNYNANGELASISDPTGVTVATYTYNDTTHRLITSTDRAGDVFHYGYTTNALATLDSIEAANGLTYTIGYDSDNRTSVASISIDNGTPAPPSESFSYLTDASGNTTTTETDANGHVWTYHFDVNGLETSSTDPLGHTEKKTWTANADVQTTTDGLNNSTTATYDSLNNETSVQSPTGAKNTIGYTNTALPHLPTSFQDPAGDQVTKSYDSRGNVTSVRSTGLAATIDTRTYNANGTVATETDGNGHVTHFSYDASGNLITVAPPAPMGATHYTYDPLGRIASITDGNGVEVDYSYDRLDRVVAIAQHAAGVLQTMSYDANGNLTARNTATDAAQFTYTGSFSGDLVSSATHSGSAGSSSVTYGYDAMGNLTLLGETDGTTTYGYDAANRLTSMHDPFGQTTTFGYNAADLRTTTTWPGAGTETVAYDAAGHQLSVTVKNTAGTQLLHTTNSYTTAAGLPSDVLQSKVDTFGNSFAFTYDPLQRVTKAGTATFTYDTAGNLTNQAGTAYTVNAADEMTQDATTAVGYDGAGNPTSTTSPDATLSYSPTNQLTGISSADGSANLSAVYQTTDQSQPGNVKEGMGSTVTTHQFTQTALGVDEVRNNTVFGTSSSISQTDVARDPNGALVTERIDFTRYNVVTDYQGSVIGLISTTGTLAANYRYSVYGTVTVSGTAAALNQFRYAGGYQLLNGQYLFGLRTYNPSWGRFTQPDPTGQENNPYAYTTGDPVNRTDVTGASALDVLGIGLGAILVGLTLVGAAEVFGLIALSAFTIESIAGIGAVGAVGTFSISLGCFFTSKC